MKRKIIMTNDGSTTIYLPGWKEQYHSKNGAVQEAQHVFLNMGLHYFIENYPTTLPINILEIGFGTGLNALLTMLEADEKKVSIRYKGVEAYPVSTEEILQMNYNKYLQDKNYELLFKKMHATAWGSFCELTPFFKLKKEQQYFQDIQEEHNFDLIYFDAFGAKVQPELWEKPIFQKMYEALRAPGVLVTYAANGKAKRALRAAGFTIEKLPGPPGKREMLRALKL